LSFGKGKIARYLILDLALFLGLAYGDLARDVQRVMILM